MDFGWAGKRRGLVLLAVGALLAAASPARTQTPDAACGADSLYLISPAALDLRLATTGRPGLTLSWPDLNRDQSTCFALTDTAGFGSPIVATGGFGDRVDRQLLFTASGGGQVGAASATNLIVNWLSEGSSAYGRLGGALNLSNNGGIWRWDAAGGSWFQTNAALPQVWRQINCVALALGGDGVLLAGFTRGSALQSDPAGLYRYAGGAWTRLAAGTFDASVLITSVAISPNDSQRFAVGTATRGLYVTGDGGQTFRQWTTDLDPSTTPPSTMAVSALEWNSQRLVVALEQFGVFVSTDGGASFTVSPFRVRSTLDAGPYTLRIPLVRDLASDPGNPARLVAALQEHGCFESTDGGLSWHDLYGDLVVPDTDPEDPVTGAWVTNGNAVAIVAGSPSTLILGVVQKGLYRSADGGVTWDLVAQESGVQPGATVNLQKFAIANVPGAPGEVAVFEDNHGLLRSADGGVSWQLATVQPVLKTGQFLLPGATNGEIILGSWGGGLYVPGTALPLHETYTAATSPPSLRSLNLGLSLTFGAGTIDDDATFRVKAQTFQGWAVWRALAADPDNMTLIGLYDRVNPEDCIVGYCGDESYEVVPRCFAAKRAACFEFSTPDTVRFFDDEVYNGFGYYYAVSSFDYGNTALVSPENNAATLLFSPRWQGDPQAPFFGAGTRRHIEINEPTAAPTAGDEIYAFPNPVRRGAGFPGDEGERVAFTNLPPGASVQVFTVAGDDVNKLGAENQVGGQIYWNTDNHDGEMVAPGVYLYKVEMPQRPAYWGRIVVIR